jgi:hypothetical protein
VAGVAAARSEQSHFADLSAATVES